MKLIPLQQWFCDKCGQIIERPEQGWSEWLYDQKLRKYGFKIVHHLDYSPIGNREDAPCCYHYDRQESCRMDDHLNHFVGEDGLSTVLVLLEPDQDNHCPGVLDVREWIELFRRLYVPHYEEARHCLRSAASDEALACLKELPDCPRESLIEIINTYSEQGDQE